MMTTFTASGYDRIVEESDTDKKESEDKDIYDKGNQFHKESEKLLTNITDYKPNWIKRTSTFYVEVENMEDKVLTYMDETQFTSGDNILIVRSFAGDTYEDPDACVRLMESLVIPLISFEDEKEETEKVEKFFSKALSGITDARENSKEFSKKLNLKDSIVELTYSPDTYLSYIMAVVTNKGNNKNQLIENLKKVKDIRGDPASFGTMVMYKDWSISNSIRELDGFVKIEYIAEVMEEKNGFDDKVIDEMISSLPLLKKAEIDEIKESVGTFLENDDLLPATENILEGKIVLKKVEDNDGKITLDIGYQYSPDNKEIIEYSDGVLSE